LSVSLGVAVSGLWIEAMQLKKATQDQTTMQAIMTQPDVGSSLLETFNGGMVGEGKNRNATPLAPLSRVTHSVPRSGAQGVFRSASSG
jgi:hypothetical protein